MLDLRVWSSLSRKTLRDTVYENNFEKYALYLPTVYLFNFFISKVGNPIHRSLSVTKYWSILKSSGSG